MFTVKGTLVRLILTVAHMDPRVGNADGGFWIQDPKPRTQNPKPKNLRLGVNVSKLDRFSAKQKAEMSWPHSTRWVPK